MPIYFYTPADKYGDFSNFSKHGIEMQGKWYRTVEHYFQAQKFENTEHSEKVRMVATAKVAANLGRSRDVPIRADWETVKDEVMYQAVLTKFRTHEKIRDLLLSTGSETIVENAKGDFYWGCGQDGSGQNKLGQILMEVRDRLREKTWLAVDFQGKAASRDVAIPE